MFDKKLESIVFGEWVALNRDCLEPNKGCLQRR